MGKAGLGKTGRVINKLVSDNDALKRDIQIEKLRAEEARQTTKLLEDKIDRIIADYESRLLEAQVTKTLLARKERQVETLSSQLSLEKKKAVDAMDREKSWKDEMERCQFDAKRKVEQAETKVALFEGRYNTVANYWKEQREEFATGTAKLHNEIADLVEERRKDDEKISVLRDLCDQQNSNIRDLIEQKETIAQKFEAYKREKEQSLFKIKANAQEAEENQVRILAESKEVLNKLKWALNIKDLDLGS